MCRTEPGGLGNDAGSTPARLRGRMTSYPGSELGGQPAYRFGACRLRVGVEHSAYERGPDDDGVGVTGHLGRLITVGDAETHTDGQVGRVSDPLHKSGRGR